ncbi:hypothetical protein GBF35_16500 [Nonomuraea phyllanthi]|uniref:hypothetical protein n=1 Tax=Nonomuraea phyllanthi TaxID=2219224 RepID=UPI00129406F5|nr:hypothetical protein [Nonomuraea phyllanthi]QFY08066.1 hypothetical protein GBF35_16500 [Nonomuraea phyllanthi]
MTATTNPSHWIYQGRVSLDWHKSPGHWGGGRRRPCRLCRRLCFLLDDDGRPVHKVCLEQALTDAMPATAERRAA